MEPDDEAVKAKPEVVIGGDLAAISVDELRKRIILLEDEISRQRAEIARKESSKDSAESFFKN